MAPPVAGYQAWYDAQAITGVADGTVLANWPDLTGNGVNLNNHAGTPTYFSTTTAKLINGHPAVYFNADGYMSSSSALSVAQPFTIFVVYKYAASGTRYTCGSAGSLAVGNDGSGGVYRIYAGSFISGGTPDTAVHVVTAQFHGSTSLIRVDGTQIVSGNAGATGMSSSFVVGDSSPSVDAAVWGGPIGEIIVYPSALSTANMASVESYLSSRWVAAVPVTGTATITIGPLAVASTPGVIGACLRKAWLTLGDLDVSLEDPTQGYFCTQLDLGYPAVREVISNNPDRNGAQDRTQYLGSRVVSANITTLAGAGGRIDQVASMFAPFMLPSARPVLHYVLDRPGLPERTLTVRASGYAWPVAGPYQRDIQLQWVASDPVARDPNLKTATALIAGSATIATPGDIPVLPVFRITGPLTGPSIGLGLAGPPYTTWFLAFLSSFSLTTGHYVEIDTANRTVFLDGDPAQPRLASMDWTVSSWQWIPPLPSSTIMSLTGSGDGPTTRVDAIWQDGYLT
jgi:hypothetical protein